MKDDFNKPVRADQPFWYNQMKAVTTLQYTIGFLGFLVIMLIVMLVFSLKKPLQFAVIDISSGQSFRSKVVENLNESIVEKQIIYYSREFIEQYLDADYMSIQKSRESAYKVMVASMQKSLPKNWTSNDDIQTALTNKSTCSFKWNIKPTITKQEDNRYTVFCNFERTVTMVGYKPWTTKHYIRLDIGRMTDYDPFERAHGLAIIKQTELSEDSKEVIDQLQLIK